MIESTFRGCMSVWRTVGQDSRKLVFDISNAVGAPAGASLHCCDAAQELSDSHFRFTIHGDSPARPQFLDRPVEEFLKNEAFPRARQRSSAFQEADP